MMKTRKIGSAILASLFLVSTPISTPSLWAQDDPVSQAVAAPDRPESDRSLDESRKPVETLRFLGLRKGDQALDLAAGGGYYTSIMATITGENGRVVAVNSPAFSSSEKSLRKWADLTGRPDNIELSLQNFANFRATEDSYDFALMHLVYHDVYWQSEKFGIPRAEPSEFLAMLYKTMKPGGIVGVIDHVGPAGDPRTVVEAMHRIDPMTVKSDFTAAGFILEAESDHLAVAEDDHSKNVFDPAIRGKTDRFVMRFRKPN